MATTFAVRSRDIKDLSIRFDSIRRGFALADRVDVYAARMERSRGWIVKQAFADWIWREEKDRLTREAMAEVDAGRVIPHEEVRTWALNLGSDNPLPKPEPRRR